MRTARVIRPNRLPPRLALALALTLAACGSAPKTNYYTLAPGDDPRPAVVAQPASSPIGVMVGPVTLPDVVDRPNLVVRTAENQVALLDQHRWAEPLKREIPRVLAGHLARLLGTPRVSVFPYGAAGSGDLRVRVDVQRFESVPGQEALLEVFWTVIPPTGERRAGHWTVHVPVAGPGSDALVAAHGLALERLAEELAAQIRERRTAS
jgi:uncharacterized lipoprotein YmbA